MSDESCENISTGIDGVINSLWSTSISTESVGLTSENYSL